MRKKRLSEKQLEAQINKLRNELSTLRERREGEENAKLYRKCFKYRNSYSRPKPNEYWWLYLRVTAVEGSAIYVTQFQTDCNGKREFETTVRYGASLFTEEISEKEFSDAFAAFKKGIIEP